MHIYREKEKEMEEGGETEYKSKDTTNTNLPGKYNLDKTP